MSVLIKGMEIPESCWDNCPFERENIKHEVVCSLTRKGYNWGLTERPSDCPLVEVPPHGDLIDRDALKEKWLAAENRMGADKVLHLPLKDYISDGCVYDLEQMPTIIEAEEET